MKLLYPSDPFTPRLADEMFRAEANAAQELGIDVIPVDVDDLLRDPHRAVRRLTVDGQPLLYRGWMLSGATYRALEVEVTRRGCWLLTSTPDYEAAHKLPSWYAHFDDHTPRSAWTTSASLDELVMTTLQLKSGGPVVLKDYVKSEKHRWLEAAFVPDVGDEKHLRAVAAKLHEYRGDDFVGGFVIRDFEQFTGPEMRTWWVHNHHVLSTAHPDTPDQLPGNVDIGWLQNSVAALGKPFITVDLIRNSNDALRVVEIGDGQVSDRPASADPRAFVEALITGFDVHTTNGN